MIYFSSTVWICHTQRGLQTAHLSIYQIQNEAAHSIFFVQSQLCDSLKCDELSLQCIQINNTANPEKTQTNIAHWERLHFAWWFSALVSFQPGSHQISAVCAKRAACGSTGWFFKVLQDWQVYSLQNGKGLSLSAAPEPSSGSVLRQANFVKPGRQPLFSLRSYKAWWIYIMMAGIIFTRQYLATYCQILPNCKPIAKHLIIQEIIWITFRNLSNN